MCVQKAPSIGQSVIETLVSERQDGVEQAPDFGASASIPEPWDDITGNKVIATLMTSVLKYKTILKSLW